MALTNMQVSSEQLNNIAETINTNNSLTLNLSNGYRGLIMGFSVGDSKRNFAAMVSVSTSGGTPSAFRIDGYDASTNITIDTSVSNKITITSASSSGTSVRDLTFTGTISVAS